MSNWVKSWLKKFENGLQMELLLEKSGYKSE